MKHQFDAVTVFLIASINLLVDATIRPACDKRYKCGQRFRINQFRIRHVGTYSNGTQTCTDQCTLFPGRKIWFRSGYECGECVTSTIVNEFSSELIVSSCNASSVTVQGTGTGSLHVGEHFIYVSSTSFGVCINCSPLFRKIVSISDGPTDDTKILTTSFLTFIEVFDNDVVDMTVAADTEIEPIFNCTYQSVNDRSLQSYHSNSRMTKPFPAKCSDWLTIRSSGSCLYTNTFIGDEGNPDHCFVCRYACDDTCGSENGIKVSRDFILFDFQEACCIHGHCYRAWYDRASCDQEFLSDMISTCPNLSPLIRIVGPIGYIALQGSCPLTALLFYGLVRNFGAVQFSNAHFDQSVYTTLY